MRTFLVEHESGRAVGRNRIQLGEYLEQWLETVKPDLRPSTWDAYANDAAKLTDKIGAVRIQELTPLQIEKVYAELMVDGGRYGRPLSAKTIRNVHAVLRRALSDAERLGLIVSNPARAAHPPRADRKELATWSADELGRFLEAVETIGCTRRTCCSPRLGCGGERCSVCGGATSTSTPGTCRSSRR